MVPPVIGMESREQSFLFDTNSLAGGMNRTSINQDFTQVKEKDGQF